MDQGWEGKFGNEYTKRNKDAPDRSRFWDLVLKTYRPKTVLEVGCNVGFNVGAIAHLEKDIRVWGVDINEQALRVMHQKHPMVSGGWATIFDMPFKDRAFDLVFTVGLLIHIKPKDLPDAIRETWRVTGETLLVAEYYSEDFQEIPYRGMDKFLFKGPYGRAVTEVTGAKVDATGYLSKEDGFDRVTWWSFKK